MNKIVTLNFLFKCVTEKKCWLKDIQCWQLRQKQCFTHRWRMHRWTGLNDGIREIQFIHLVFISFFLSLFLLSFLPLPLFFPFFFLHSSLLFPPLLLFFSVFPFTLSYREVNIFNPSWINDLDSNKKSLHQESRRNRNSDEFYFMDRTWWRVI